MGTIADKFRNFMRNEIRFMRKNNRKKNILIPGLLFSGMGFFAWMLLTGYTDLSFRAETTLSSVWAKLFLILLFNVLGFLTLQISAWLNEQYVLNARKKWKIAVAYAAVLIMFLLVNYGFLVAGKLLAGASQPFIFPNGGIRILVAVWLVELAVLGLLLSNRATEQTLKFQQQAASLQKENNAARYAALQSQLNPHFLFNSLNTLVAEIEYDPARAVSFTRNLSEVYRYVLQVQDRLLITLDEEVKFASAYLFLHEVRLGNCIVCRCDIPDNELEYRLPPLTLQLLIENIIKHNSISATRPMEIGITASDGWLTVTNTLRPKKSDKSTGIGLENLTNRCRMTSGRGIEVTHTENLFIVKVPLIHG